MISSDVLWYRLTCLGLTAAATWGRDSPHVSCMLGAVQILRHCLDKLLHLDQDCFQQAVSVHATLYWHYLFRTCERQTANTSSRAY
jgi:hypothetical protein